MINFKLKELAQKINKNISDLSRETGINRNTITAIFHNQINGIKFSTLEKLCEKYNWTIEELLSYAPTATNKISPNNIYRQQGEMVPFTIWPAIAILNQEKNKYFTDYGDFDFYFKQGYWFLYLRINTIEKLAEIIYRDYQDKLKIDNFYNGFLLKADELKNIYLSLDPEEIVDFSQGEIIEFWNKLRPVYEAFWSWSSFIDVFDAGVDKEKIKELAKRYGFSTEEISILTTPTEMTFINEKKLALLSLAKKIKPSGQSSRDGYLEKLVETRADFKKYRKDFDYYQTNYVTIKHLTTKEIVKELKKYLSDKKLLNDEYEKLVNYHLDQEKAIEKILKKYKLKENPLYFFARLTIWREKRKQINLMGIHLLFYILAALECQTGIAQKYLSYLLPIEIESLFRGAIDSRTLHRRYNQGIMIINRDDNCKIISGDEAVSLKTELDDAVDRRGQEKIIVGQVASQGYARGKARIVLKRENFSEFKEGEILITSMTTPEYAPLMKKAAAVVTDQGGITCHAAIISRELGLPCIIGTQVATKKIKTGDLVEVRANHGTVRIIS